MKNKRKITIEDLAVITKKGFDEVDKRFDKVETRFDKVETRFDKVETRLTDLEKKVDRLPDKDYLDDKLADLEGNIIIRQRKQEKRFNILLEILKKKKVLGPTDVKILKSIQIFPK